jgi:hypothetical protein
VGSAIVATEINYYYNAEDKKENWVKTMISICNISTLLFSKLTISSFLTFHSFIYYFEQNIIYQMDG